MATQNLMEEEGIFYYLREQYGSVENAVAANPDVWAGAGAWPGTADEASLREALTGPQHDQIIAVLIGLAKAPPPAEYDAGAPNMHRNGPRDRTETVDNNETITIHAEKNQDIEVENDETHFAPKVASASVWDDTDIVHVTSDDGPAHLLGDLHARVANHSGAGNFWGDDNGGIPFDQLKGVWGDPHVNELVGQVHGVTGGDFNGDGPDTVGVGDFDGDGMVDAADYAV